VRDNTSSELFLTAPRQPEYERSIQDKKCAEPQPSAWRCRARGLRQSLCGIETPLEGLGQKATQTRQGAAPDAAYPPQNGRAAAKFLRGPKDTWRQGQKCPQGYNALIKVLHRMNGRCDRSSREGSCSWSSAPGPASRAAVITSGTDAAPFSGRCLWASAPREAALPLYRERGRWQKGARPFFRPAGFGFAAGRIAPFPRRHGTEYVAVGPPPLIRRAVRTRQKHAGTTEYGRDLIGPPTNTHQKRSPFASLCIDTDIGRARL